jgi:hypothetical protein
MGKLATHPALSAIVLAGVTVTWSRFHSNTYPYSVLQPSSFRHAVLSNTANQQVDYFFPSLGSFTTNFNVEATPGHSMRDEASYLRSENGHNIHRVGWLRIAGQKVALMHANFGGLAGNYSIDQVCFMAGSKVWQLTASYDAKFRSLRATLLKMLRSFRLDS